MVEMPNFAQMIKQRIMREEIEKVRKGFNSKILIKVEV